ncbi:MAG: hypothetical protein QNL04_10955 [SAR324 cluster bacterium]|nr:hypothetical protein [SAR324 cluster bacterium]
MKYFTLLLLSLVILASPILAQDYSDEDGLAGILEDDMLSGGELEVDLGGSFAQDPTETPEIETSAASLYRLSIDHAVSFRTGEIKSMVNNRTGLNLDYAGSLAAGLYAKIDATGTLYWAKDHRAQTAEKDYDYDGLIREAWVQKSYDQINFKVGLQSIVWGDVEGAQATDTLNPTDNSEFLFVDFEDVRIGQATVLTNLYTDHFKLEAFVTPTPLFNKNPPSNSIYAYPNPFASLDVTEAEKPNPEYGARVKFKVGASEMALLAAKLTPNQPLYKLEGAGLTEVAQPFLLYGFNFNYPSGQTLFKADLGYKTDQGVNDQSFDLVFKDRLDAAFGVETTFSQHSLVASVSLSTIQNWDESLVVAKQSGFYNLSWSKSYLNEDLTLNLGALGVISKSDTITSAIADYRTSDQLQFSCRLFYFSVTDTDSQFYSFREENRAEIASKYQF